MQTRIEPWKEGRPRGVPGVEGKVERSTWKSENRLGLVVRRLWSSSSPQKIKLARKESLGLPRRHQNTEIVSQSVSKLGHQNAWAPEFRWLNWMCDWYSPAVYAHGRLFHLCVKIQKLAGALVPALAVLSAVPVPARCFFVLAHKISRLKHVPHGVERSRRQAQACAFWSWPQS